MSLLQKAVGAVVRILPDKAPDPLMDSGRVVGQPVSRVDGPLKVTGKARFAAEVPFENLAFAALAYSSIARGSIASIDTAEAESAPGVGLGLALCRRLARELGGQLEIAGKNGPCHGAAVTLRLPIGG